MALALGFELSARGCIGATSRRGIKLENPYQTPLTAAVPGAGMSTPIGVFKNPTILTWVTRACLVAGALISVAALVSWSQEYALLQRAQAGELTLDEVYEQTMLTTLLVALPQTLVTFGSYIAIGMWIYRVAWNARAFAGASRMDFTPGWSVGWYFVPFANLWKPYQAMKQIWRASAAAARMETASVPWWLPLWWMLWLVGSAAGNVSARMTWNADTPEGEMNASVAMMISDALNIPLCLVFLLIVNRVVRMQHQQQLQRHEAVAG